MELNSAVGGTQSDRHDAQIVAGVICDVIDSSQDVSDKIRAEVTDNAAVMVADWREVERRKTTIKCERAEGKEGELESEEENDADEMFSICLSCYKQMVT